MTTQLIQEQVFMLHVSYTQHFLLHINLHLEDNWWNNQLLHGLTNVNPSNTDYVLNKLKSLKVAK